MAESTIPVVKESALKMIHPDPHYNADAHEDSHQHNPVQNPDNPDQNPDNQDQNPDNQDQNPNNQDQNPDDPDPQHR